MTKFYFQEPRLKLSSFGNFGVRLVTYSVYIILSISTLLFLFSGLSNLRWLGLMLSLFLIDRLLHIGQADRNLTKLKGKRINLAFYLTPSTRTVLDYAYRKAKSLGWNFNLVLFRELLTHRDIKTVLRRLEIDYGEIDQKLESYLNQSKESVNKKELLSKIEALVIASYEEAIVVHEKYIEPRNLLAALANITDPQISKLLSLFNVSATDFREAAIFGRYRRLFAGVRRLPATFGGFGHRPYRLRHRVMNRAWTARPTPILDQFSTDLTDLARTEKIGFLIGHKDESRRLLDTLSRPSKPNVLLVGWPGSGKTTMVANLAYRLVKDQVPKNLFDKRLVSLDIGSLMANAPAEILADRLKSAVDEIYQAGNIILHIPEFEDLLRTSGQEGLNAMDMLLPIFKSDVFPVVAETYPRDFKQSIEPRSDILNVFEVIRVEEIEKKEALRFLVYDSLILEKTFNIIITFRAIKKAVDLASRYFRPKLLPGSAEELLKQALIEAKHQDLKILGEDLVIVVAEKRSKIPLQRAGDEEVEKLLNLENLIHKHLINQNQAVKAVSEALRQYRSGLARRGGPIATFLFVGPTGVGKTELSKILTRLQFGSKDMMIRFDMSEYQEKISISRFLGSANQGMVSSLTEAVLEKPYSLILLDEFEKAHPDILNLFLQVFDDGRLTDNLGRTVDFQNTIIIATSNAHSGFIKTEIEKKRPIEEISEELKKKLTSIFRPELINRFSSTIVFRNLSLKEIVAITRIQLNQLTQTLKEVQGIDLSFDDTVIKKIAELGYSPVFGARPLRQVISEKIKSVLAEKLLRKEIARGNGMRVVLEGDSFVFKIEE